MPGGPSRRPVVAAAGRNPDEVTTGKGGIHLVDLPSIGETYVDILARHGRPEITADGERNRRANGASPLPSGSFAAWFAEVRVDAELGRLRVARIVSAVDAGRILNEKLARSQIIGGAVMGIGMTMLEEVHHTGWEMRMTRGSPEFIPPKWIHPGYTRSKPHAENHHHPEHTYHLRAAEAVDRLDVCGAELRFADAEPLLGCEAEHADPRQRRVNLFVCDQPVGLPRHPAARAHGSKPQVKRSGRDGGDTRYLKGRAGRGVGRALAGRPRTSFGRDR